MKNKVLVTGAGGYIGSVSTYLFLQNGWDVVAVDNYTTGFQEPLTTLKEQFGDQITIYNTDLRKNIGEVFDKEKDISAVVHYAASCLVDESMKNPHKYFDNNVIGSLNLIEAMVQHNVLNLVFSSTCAVYGEAEYVPVDEKHPTKPANPYGESKLMIEHMIQWYGKLKGLNYVILRYFNVCGASDDGVIGDAKKPSVLLVQNAVRGALGIEPFFLTSPEVDTPDKTPIRDYVNVVDLNEAHIKAVEYLKNKGTSEIINLGSGTGSSVKEIIQQVQNETGKKFELKSTTPRQGEYAKMIALIDKATNVLGWKPKRTMQDTVKSLLVWYEKHPQGWSK